MWVTIANTDKPIRVCYITAYITSAQTVAAIGDWLGVYESREKAEPSKGVTQEVSGHVVNTAKTQIAFSISIY